VLLTSTAPLDWDGGPREAHIVQSQAAGLKLVFRSKNWLIYELPHATPLLTGPAHPVVTAFGHTVTSGRVSSAGRYLLREHYNPYWHLHGAGCVARGPDHMTILDLSGPQTFSLTVPGTPQSLVGQLVDGKQTNCSSSS
jgi:hypothetical protein